MYSNKVGLFGKFKVKKSEPGNFITVNFNFIAFVLLASALLRF